MGLFKKKKKIEYLDVSGNLLEEYRQQAIRVLTQILSTFHSKNYGAILSIVDESRISDLENYLVQYLQGTLELNDFTTIDEYGVECSFKPPYEYHQLEIELYNDNSGFYLEYAMTSSGDLVDITLHLDFLFTDKGLKSIFVDIEPQ